MTTKRRLLTIAVLSFVSLLLSLWILRAPGGLADSPLDANPFRWVQALEQINPREFPDHLSRPDPAYTAGPSLASSPDLTVDFAHYPFSAEIITFCQELETLYPTLVETYQVGTSWQGQRIIGLRLGNEATGDPDTRPALYLDGQHHGREPVSQQVVLYSLWYLLSNYGSDPLVTHLLDTRTVYAIPSVNVDGNDIMLQDDFTQRRTANPTSSDDDLDGSFDEDPPNGMGYGTYAVYRYDFDQAWADAHPNDPFASGWERHYVGGAYLGVFDGQDQEIPQFDDDGDGRLNCDPIGGVDANRNYEVHWELGESNPASPGYRGPTVWSEPETRAVRDFVLAHGRIVVGLSYHSGADLILHPWAWSAEADLPDVFIFEQLSRKGSQLTECNGFLGAPHTWTARGLYTNTGSTMDWLYEHGIHAWSPETYGASLIAFATRIGSGGSFRVGLSSGVAQNPAPANIRLTAERWNHFNLYLLAALPHVELTQVQAQDGGLTLTVANDGYLPVDLTITVTGQGGFLASQTIGHVQAAQRPVSTVYPYGWSAQTLVITLTARSQIGTMVKELESESVELRIEEMEGPEKVSILRGHMSVFIDLGMYFGEGGWLAPPGWDSSKYHLGPPLLRELFLPILYR